MNHMSNWIQLPGTTRLAKVKSLQVRAFLMVRRRLILIGHTGPDVHSCCSKLELLHAALRTNCRGYAEHSQYFFSTTVAGRET